MKPRLFPSPIASLCLSFAFGQSLSAAVYNWDNGSADLQWNTTSSNWTGSMWPASGSDNDAVFGATGVGTVQIDTAGVSVNDLTFSTAGYTLAGPGILTLSDTTNVITNTAASTISANLAGTSGFTKAGAQTLTLSGNNSGLSGTITLDNVINTNGAGIVFTSAAAAGGITNIVNNGTTTSGQFIRIAGTGVAMPSSLNYQLSGQGGNSAPAGTLVSAGTGVNSVAGAISIKSNGVRISNTGATRLDITGAITQGYTSAGSDSLSFRFADNEGVHLMNTANSWSVQTINGQGVLWFDPGTLPTTTNLVVAASNTGYIQTSGTFTRALGTAANQVQFTLSAARAMGFGARGGDLTLNFGGAGADISFDTAAGAAATAIRSNTFVLNNSTATHNLTLVNALNINGAARTIEANNNIVELTGGLKNSGATATLSKTGAGLMKVSGAVTGPMTFANSNGSTVFTGGVSGAVAFTASAGTTEISGAGANSFTGLVTVNGGNFLVKRSDGLGTTTGATNTGGGQNQGSLQFDATGGDISLADNITLGMRASLVANSFSSMKPNINNLAGNTTLSGLINGGTGGAVSKISSAGGTLTISGEYRQSGATPVASTRIGHLQGSGNGIISGTITQAANILHRVDKVGTGTWTFTGTANTFSGGIRIAEGTLAATNFGNGGVAGGLGAGSASASTIVINGGSLKYTGAGESSDRLFTIGASGATLDASGSGALNLTGTSSYITADGNNNVQLSFASGATTFATNETTALTVGMVLDASVAGVPTPLATGIAAGTKIVSIDHTAGLITVDLPSTAASAVANANGSGVFDRTLTLTGTNTAQNVIAGSFQNAANGGKLGITKTGSGTWVLNGNHTYTGDTLVSAGTLLINGALGNTNVTVSASAILGGGTATAAALGGNALIAGTLAPGNSPGTIDIAGNLDLASTATLNWELNPSNMTIGSGINDLVNVGGMITLDGTLNVSGVTSFSGVNSGTWTLFTFSTVTDNGLTLGSLPTLDSGYTWQYNTLSNSSTLSIVAVPEISSSLLTLMSLPVLLRRRRNS